MDLPIFHGTEADTLLDGVGHLAGSSLPVGGAGTHAVLAAHSGLASATLFTDLRLLTNGDEFSIWVMGEQLRYRVTSTTTVLPSRTESLSAKPGRDLVTLLTCTPIGVNTHRLLVQAERIPAVAATPGEPATPSETPSVPQAATATAGTLPPPAVGVHWWIAAVVLTPVVTWRLTRPRRP